MKSKICIYSLLLIALSFTGCKKYLEAKSDQSLGTITNVTDLQSLLDNYNLVNFSTVSADMASSDDYYLNYPDFQALDFEQQRNMYTWQPSNIFYPYTNLPNDWNSVYNNIYIANNVLANIDNVNRTPINAAALDDIKGQALFLRAYNFYKAVTIWSLAYDHASSATDAGIPLRLNVNFNERSTRANVEQSYQQILNDLKLAIPIISKTPLHVYRGSKAAAYALLSRTYLAMRIYDQAKLYADSCLQINDKLIDFNKLNISASFPIPKFNDEILYDTNVGGSGATPITRTKARVDSLLILMYSPNDLRLTAFFSTAADGSKLFKGSYEGASTRFNGMTTDEMYLTRAECLARNNETVSAMADLNHLLVSRYKNGLFQPLVANSATDALNKILLERRKELVMRGTRWADIKRLNKDGANILLKRVVNGVTYTLPPNNPRYALPIPDDVIALSGMQQNPR